MVSSWVWRVWESDTTLVTSSSGTTSGSALLCTGEAKHKVLARAGFRDRNREKELVALAPTDPEREGVRGLVRKMSAGRFRLAPGCLCAGVAKAFSERTGSFVTADSERYLRGSILIKVGRDGVVGERCGCWPSNKASHCLSLSARLRVRRFISGVALEEKVDCRVGDIGRDKSPTSGTSDAAMHSDQTVGVAGGDTAALVPAVSQHRQRLSTSDCIFHTLTRKAVSITLLRC